MEQEEKRTSKFSSGVNIIIRVDYLWKNCHEFKRSGYYSKWNEELDSVWLELARDLDEEEYYDLDKEKNVIKNSKENPEKVYYIGYKSQFEEFDERMKKYLPFNDSGNFGFQKPTNKMLENRENQYRLLMEKQLFLARLENELGKGTSWEEEDDDF